MTSSDADAGVDDRDPRDIRVSSYRVRLISPLITLLQPGCTSGRAGDRSAPSRPPPRSHDPTPIEPLLLGAPCSRRCTMCANLPDAEARHIPRRFERDPTMVQLRPQRLPGLLLAGAAMMIVFAAACGGGDGEETSSSATAAGGDGGAAQSDADRVNDVIEAARSTPPLIAFSSVTGERGERAIHVMSADGSGLRVLPDAIAAGNSWGATWSPDGTRIAFSTDEARSPAPYGPNDPTDIYVMRADGSDITRLTSLLPAYNLEPAWSPDGARIAFTSRLGLDSQVAVVNVDGSDLVILTRGPGDSHDPAWSPDGHEIAFTARYDDDLSEVLPGWLSVLAAIPDGRPHIFVMSADGSNLRKLTSDSAGEGSPAWSPDGSQIAFVSYRDDARDPDLGGNPEIYVVSAGGGTPTPLTDDPAGDFEPTWSPDGSKIAFASGRDSYNPTKPIGFSFLVTEIYVMNADGSDQTRISEAGGRFPSFGPTAPADAIAAAPLPPAQPVGLAISNFPTDGYTYRQMIEAIASGDFASVEDTPRARALVFSIMQQLNLWCDAPNNLPLRVPLATVQAYAGAPTDLEGGVVNFLQTLLDIRDRAEQGDLLSAPERITGVFVTGDGVDRAAQEDGALLADSLGCGSVQLEQFWRNLSFVISSRSQKTPSR